MNFHEIEELFKAVNHNAIKALLRAAQVMKDPNASPEMRAQAEANYKAISQNKPIPKPATEKKPKAVPAAAPAQVPFHEEFARVHNVDPVKFKAAYDAMNPEQRKMTEDHHAAHMKTLTPAAAPVAPATPTPAPVAPVVKSIDALHDLFTQLKARL